MAMVSVTIHLDFYSGVFMFDFSSLFYYLYLELGALITAPINIHILQYVDSFGLLAPILDAFELNVVVGLVLVNLYSSLAVLNLLVSRLLTTLTTSTNSPTTLESLSHNTAVSNHPTGANPTSPFKTFKTLTLNLKIFLSNISKS